MTPEETIEALREWADKPYPYAAGVLTDCAAFALAHEQVRAILDPPVPEWRRLADAWSWTAADIPDEPAVLANVLSSLAGIAAGKVDPDWLAPIIAICEQQMGDGWQADPDDTGGNFSLGMNDRWQWTGNRAAAWLRDLTEADR